MASHLRDRQVIVIGAGHNGLVCAALLARRGVQVTLLEALPSPGGMAGSTKFAPGFRVPHCAHLLYSPDARVVRELKLYAHGFEGVPPLRTCLLQPDGGVVQLTGHDVHGPGIDAAAAAQYRRLRSLLDRCSEVLAQVAARRPPRLGASGLSAHAELLRLALAARTLPRSDIRELLRIGTGSVHDLLEDYLDDERLRAALGPRSGNTVLNLLHRGLGRGAARRQGHAVRRASGQAAGLQAFVSALSIAARDHGVALRTATPVQRVLIEDGRARGVELDGGEVLKAHAVVSSLDPRSTLLRLVGADHLEAGVVQRLSRLRCDGRAAKLHVALSRMPAWRGVDAARLDPGEQVRFLYAPDRATIERAFDASKYGEVPAHPVLEFVIPSLQDPSLCAPGRHVLSAVVQYAPGRPRAGLDAARRQLERAALDVLATLAPDFHACVEASELLLPADLEARFGVTGGHWHHGELAVDQYLMLRPMNGMSRYRTPVSGLWLCGAGTHPGGGVMGTAGSNAARELLRALAAGADDEGPSAAEALRRLTDRVVS